MQIFSTFQGFLILAGYAVVASLIIWFFSRGFSFTKIGFLIAGGKVGAVPAAFSIAAAWIWAPALFVSAEKAYTQGWVGLFWFLVPNVACLVLFSFFARKLRVSFPDGITLSGYMRQRFSYRVQVVYLVAFGGLAVCSFAVQLLAGGKIISMMSGLPYFWVTVLLAVIPVGYSLYSGLKASIISDFLLMVVMLVIGTGIVSWTILVGGGPEVVMKGLNGKSGTYDSLFSGDGLNVFYTFGIPVTIGLLSGPFGDQSFWQRAYAVKKESVQLSFLLAAFVFALVPFSLSMLGFLAAGGGLKINNTAQVNIETVLHFLPGWVSVPFLYLLLAGLVSTLDSNLSALSSLFGHDVLSIVKPGIEHGRRDVSRYSKWAMAALVVGGIAIANIPGLTILYLFLFYGTLRASTFLPTIITLLKKGVSENGMFWGILISLLGGLPTFAYGNLYKIPPAIIGGSLFTVLASGIIVFLASIGKKESRES
jgi:Na+/proline symporter